MTAAAESTRRSMAEVQHRRNQQVDRLIGEGNAKARRVIDTARRCRKCGTGVTSPGRDIHWACQEPLIGSVCTCPPGCTNTSYGDAGTCLPECIPCRVLRGQRYSKR